MQLVTLSGFKKIFIVITIAKKSRKIGYIFKTLLNEIHC